MAGKSYQSPPSDEFVETIWSRGYLTGFELARIAAWKSAQSVASITVNSEEQIRDCTQKLLSRISEFRTVDVIGDEVDWAQWRECVGSAIGRKARPSSGLLQLQGIGYPMATAVLAVLAPTSFPVMDKWAIAEIFSVHPQEASKTKWHKAVNYVEYCRHLVDVMRPEFASHMNIHERDQAVMRAGMEYWTLNRSSL